MYELKIKASANDLDIPVTRSLLFFSLIVIALYIKAQPTATGIIAAAIIAVSAFFVERLIVQFRIHLLFLVGIAAILLLVISKQIWFSLVLMIIAGASRAAYTTPAIHFTENEITIRKSYSKKKYDWQQLSNVVVKDGLLTLDFRNNKILQLELTADSNINEQEFNHWCSTKIRA